MYSILLRVVTPSADRWKYLYNDDGSLYKEDDLEKVKLKVIELLKDHLLSDIQVVKNYIIHEDVTIEEVV